MGKIHDIKCINVSENIHIKERTSLKVDLIMKIVIKAWYNQVFVAVYMYIILKRGGTGLWNQN